MTYEELTAALRSQGGEPGRPAHVPAEAEEQDRDSFAERKCGECGLAETRFEAWRCGTAYVGVAYCPRCRSAEEV